MDTAPIGINTFRSGSPGSGIVAHFLAGLDTYTHGEWATLVVRVRNVGREEVKFQYLRQFFVEQPSNTSGQTSVF